MGVGLGVKLLQDDSSFPGLAEDIGKQLGQVLVHTGL